jgi:hypothetical protein
VNSVHQFLWRGQKVSPRGFCLFRTDGITTRQMDGGDPAYVRRAGLLPAILAHIQPRDGGEEAFLRTSSFLSFSASEEVAKKYAVGRSAKRLIPCAVYGEDAVIFRLEASGRRELQEKGLFEIAYDCDYSLSRPNSRGPGEEETARAVSCEYCGDGRKRHRALLVDVVMFLEDHPGKRTRPDALESAIRDQEWLVYPADYVGRLKGYQSRVPLSKIWKSRSYQLE